MAKTTSFALGDDLNDFIQQEIDNGTFASASEVVRVALTEYAERTTREREFYAALDRGLASKRAKAGVFARVRRRRAVSR